MSPLLVLLFIGGAAYLILTPVEGLQVAVPAFVSTPSPLQIGEIGMPVADKIEWNSLPAFYELTNQLVIPLLKQYWLYWIPFWILVLLISRFTPEKEG